MNRSLLFKIFTTGIASCALALAPVQAEVVLKHKIQDNTTLVTEVRVQSEQTLTLAGMDLETKANNVITVKLQSAKRDANGDIQVTTKVDALQTQISLPGGIEYQFDSANPDQKAPIEQLEIFSKGFRAILGATFVVVHDAENRVTSITGAEDVLSKLDPKTAQYFADQFDTDYLKEKSNTEFDYIPRHAISVGDTWELTDEMRIEGGQTLTFDNIFKYLGQIDVDGRKLDKIEIHCKAVRYEMADNAPSPARIKSSELKPESKNSYLLFDRTLGRMVLLRKETKITGDMTFVINNTELPAKLNLTMTIATKVKQ